MSALVLSLLRGDGMDERPNDDGEGAATPESGVRESGSAHPPEPFPDGPLTLQQQQELVVRYTPLVRRVARSLPLEIPGVLEYEDAVGFGTCGLIEAVRRFDPEKGKNFHAYAVRRIRGAMIDAFRRMDRLSRTMRQKARAVQKAQAELEGTLERTPSEREIARHLGVSIKECCQAVASGRWVTVSLDRILEPDDQRDSFPGAEMPTADEDIDFTTRFEERERFVVSLYYVEDMTMREIAAVLTVSETRVSQLHAQAVGGCAEPCSKKRLRFDLFTTARP